MKMNLLKITEISAKTAFTAVIAELFYIIYRLKQPVCDLSDVRFVNAVPEMLELMLLSTVIVVAFMAVAMKIEKRE